MSLMTTILEVPRLRSKLVVYLNHTCASHLYSSSSDACKKLELNPPPKITVIVVGKRHHVRFFPMSASEADRSGNCPAGTVVDRDVTNPAEFDFYLQSHGGLLGTSRPAHYNILLDENQFTSVPSLKFPTKEMWQTLFVDRTVCNSCPLLYAMYMHDLHVQCRFRRQFIVGFFDHILLPLTYTLYTRRGYCMLSRKESLWSARCRRHQFLGLCNTD